MSRQIQNQYTPDYVSPPGDTILEKIQELGMSQVELARRTGRPTKTINEIIQGKASITPQTAMQLERVLSIPASFWNTRERQYRLHLAQVEDQIKLGENIEWLNKFPVKAMIKLDWIQAYDNKVQQLQELLRFFGVASPNQWDAIWKPFPVTFRKSAAFPSNKESVYAWLRQGEIEAQRISSRPYNRHVFRRTLLDIRKLTMETPESFQPNLVHLCAYSGVAVVFVPQLPKTRVSGATRWITPDKALIQLSLRYKTDDHFWFTFFHEAGHILKHGKKDIFLEYEKETNGKEEAANSFAARTLIPPARLRIFLKKVKPKRISKKAIQEFADEIGIAPGIVVGRLQHDEYLPFSYCNDLKRTFTWVKKRNRI